MAADPWAREYGEAARLADDVASMVADRAALPQSGPDVVSSYYQAVPVYGPWALYRVWRALSPCRVRCCAAKPAIYSVKTSGDGIE